jgi:MoaA/NifB/PqqE/SkfB family radical SAM enzyme
MPMTLQIEPTNRCNLLCKQCFRNDKGSKRTLGDMTFENFKAIINQFSNVFDVSLIGLGESFLNKDLPLMIDFLGEHEIDVSLTTNGTVLSDRILDSINQTPTKVQIQFSLDGVNSDTYKRIRGVDCHEKVIRNIKKFMASKQSGVDVSIGLVVMQDNMDELPDFIRLAHELNISRVHLGDLSGVWLGDNKDELLIQQKSTLKEMVIETRRVADQLSMELRYNQYDYIWEDQASLTRCWFLWQYPYITWDGYITSCCNLPNPEINNFGNLIEKPFKELWNSDLYQKFRKLLKEGRPHRLCRSCHLAN